MKITFMSPTMIPNDVTAPPVIPIPIIISILSILYSPLFNRVIYGDKPRLGRLY
ncbi:MAG: hypothetical protein ACTSXD_04765 [Candidatus Heimdallarchaeaceae archaeon]